MTEQDKPKQNNKQDVGLIIKCTNFVNNLLENFFARFGFLVGTHPKKTIFISLIFALLCLAGLLEFQQESRGEKLWVEQSSQYITDQNWVQKYFSIRIRYVQLLLKDSDVLTPNGLRQLMEIDKMVKGIYSSSSDASLHWENIHFKTPTLTLLEFWPGIDEAKINNMTKDDILEVLNTNALYSPTRKRNVTITDYISGIDGNQTHSVVSASVIRLIYFLKFNRTLDKDAGRWVDKAGTKWEIEFASVLKTKSFDGFEVFYSTLESFKKAGLDAIGNDYGLLFSGYALIIGYVAFQLGKFSSLQQKIWLALVGIIMVGLSIGVAMGLCSAAQVIYGPVHSILPFLMIGIGVDDLFVIVQTWDNVSGSINDEESIPNKISRTMRHAGVAITVTSFTDICAFLIGATTVLPALRSFCIYVGVGILMLYIYATTFFVAFLAIDAERQRKHREACCCIKLSEDWQPMACSSQMYLKNALNNFAKIVLTIPGKLIVIVITMVLFGFGMYGVLQLNQNYDPDWFLPHDSDEFIFRQQFRKYFPSHGAKSAAYTPSIDYFKEQGNLHRLYEKLKEDPGVQTSSVVSWYDHYIEYMTDDPSRAVYVSNINKTVTNETMFYFYLRCFLDADGQAYRSDLSYDNSTARMKIKGSRFRFTHKNILETKEQINAMDKIRDTASSVYFPSTDSSAFAFGNEYIRWQTNRIVGEELLRNLILAGACVFMVTLFLIANIWTSLMVLACVGFSLVNICGYMYYWDLSIDMIISTILVIALGFAVDYSGHIGHAFMAARSGTRNDRAQTALTEIGPAVLNGGISTFLAFCLLAGSQSYAFQTFFKVFFLVVSIGLFHGLVFLPVLLSIIGPRAYTNGTEGNTSKDHAVECVPGSDTVKIGSKVRDSVKKKDVNGNSISDVNGNGIDNVNFVAS